MPHEHPETFAEQISKAAAAKKLSKLRLVGELLEANRTISRMRAALEDIIESENSQDIRSYGLGDIARKALEKTT